MSSIMSSGDGTQFEMGAGMQEVGKGDAVKTGSNHLEIISRIDPVPGSNWDRRITTESGRTFTMREVLAYGKRLQQSSGTCLRERRGT